MFGSKSCRQRGFTLIEVLVTVAIVGTIGAIAVAALSGSREHARTIGDAKSNIAILQMALEGSKAETGLYPAAGTYTWTAAGSRPSPDPAPSFLVSQSRSKLDFTLVIDNTRQTYTVTAVDTAQGKQYLRMDQSGAVLP